jgi:hypothetical protein
MTAVEWLISKLPIVNDNDPYLAELIEQAKEMEKQQIIDAYNQDLYIGLTGYRSFKDGEQYYNETFKQL